MAPRPRRRLSPFLCAARRAGLVLTLVATITACGSTSGEVVASAGDLGHIHDLVVDDDILAATHTGLWRIEDLDRAVLVGTERHDLMAMASLHDGALVASGHPDMRFEQYHREDHPPFLGLTRSEDGGRSWEVVDLLGEADFHALVPVGDQLFGAETTGYIWRLNPDSTWERLGEVEARDLAVDPADKTRLVAPDYSGALWLSSDGGATWSALDDAPSVVEVEWPIADSILAADATGTIWSASSPEDEWTAVAVGPSDVETFLIDPAANWWVTVHGGAIARSHDKGETWVDIYMPPTGT